MIAEVIADYMFFHIGRQAIRNSHGRVLEANLDTKGMHLKLNTVWFWHQ